MVSRIRRVSALRAFSMVRVALVLAAFPGCSGDDDGSDAGSDPNRAARAELLDPCRRTCGLVETLQAADGCEPPRAVRRGVFIGEGEEVPDAAPLSTDQACIDQCIEAHVENVIEPYDCWQQDAADLDCTANAVWFCDETGGLSIAADCNARRNNPSLCEPDAAEPSGGEVGAEELRAAGQRYCAFLESVRGECDSGAVQKYGVILGRGEEPPAEPPISEDEVCMQVVLSQPLNQYRCKAQQVASWDCFVNTPFICADNAWSGPIDDSCDAIETDFSYCED